MRTNFLLIVGTTCWLLAAAQSAASVPAAQEPLLNRVVGNVRQNEAPLDSYEAAFAQSETYYPPPIRTRYGRFSDVVSAQPKTAAIEGRFWSKGNLKAVRYRPGDAAPKGKALSRVEKTKPPSTPQERKQVSDGYVIVDMPLNAEERQVFPGDLAGVSGEVWRYTIAMGIGVGADDEAAAAARQTIAANMRANPAANRTARPLAFANDPTRVLDLDPMRWVLPYGVPLSAFLAGKTRSPDESVSIEAIERCEVAGQKCYRVEATYAYVADRQSESVTLIVNAERGFQLQRMTVRSGNQTTETAVRLERGEGERWLPTHAQRRIAESTANGASRRVSETTVAFSRFKANPKIPDSVFDGLKPVERRYRPRVLGLSIALIVMGILL